MVNLRNTSSAPKLFSAVAVSAMWAVAGAGSRVPPPPPANESAAQTDIIPAPCHPNPHARSDMATLAQRGDVRSTPAPLKARLLRLAGRPHTFLPMQTFAEADR